MIGRTMSHCKIVEKIGEGGMGVVYKAEDSKLERAVALKFLAPHLVQDAELRKRFEREAKAAAGLSPRAILEKLSALQMIDVHLPTTAGRHIVLSRYTNPEPDVALLLAQLQLRLPAQPPPRVRASEKAAVQRRPSSLW